MAVKHLNRDHLDQLLSIPCAESAIAWRIRRAGKYVKKYILLIDFLSGSYVVRGMIFTSGFGVPDIHFHRNRTGLYIDL